VVYDEAAHDVVGVALRLECGRSSVVVRGSWVVVVLELDTSIYGASQAVELTTLFCMVLRHVMAD
jgi:hypothetical protein